MKIIYIGPDVLEINFLHEQEPEKNKSIQIPSHLLEWIITEWVKHNPPAASAVIINTKDEAD